MENGGMLLWTERVSLLGVSAQVLPIFAKGEML
jgi:hypothetical protein